jgi:hypothetical protein
MGVFRRLIDDVPSLDWRTRTLASAITADFPLCTAAAADDG